MKKFLAIALVVGLASASLAAPAAAKKKKKKKKVKLVEQTLYLHGNSEAGEADLPETWLDSLWHLMDVNKPTSATPKSTFVTNYLAGPNTSCSGNGLLPTWKGSVSGKVKGDLTVSLNTLATPAAQMVVEVFADANGGCDQETLGASDYVPPFGSAVVDVEPGSSVTEVTFENVEVESFANLVLMLHIPNAPNPAQVRVLYDSPDFASSITFSCVNTACAR